MGKSDFPFEFASITQLGSMFGVSGQAMGRCLKEIGLRDVTGAPTATATDGGVVQEVDMGPDSHPFWSWNVNKVIRLLKAAGHRMPGEVDDLTESTGSPAAKPASEPEKPPAPTKLVGPFAARRSDVDGDGFEIADSDGMVAVWTRGEALAANLAKLMTLGAENGKI
jgi:hypothetical protein